MNNFFLALLDKLHPIVINILAVAFSFFTLGLISYSVIKDKILLLFVRGKIEKSN
jgi:hypothetical protein